MTEIYSQSDSKKAPVWVRGFGVGLILAGFFAAGMVTTRVIVNAQSPHQLQGDTNMAVFWEAWYRVQEKFPFDSEEPTNAQRIQGAIEGMVDSFGDPHTNYLPPEKNKLFGQDISGKFGGVGMEVGKSEGLIVVIAPLKDSPAQQAGIRPGDFVIEINGVDVTNHSVDDAVALIRGPVGESVTLTILREGESEFLNIEVTRDIITVPTIEWSLEGDIAIISLYSFTEDVYDQLVNVHEEIQKERAGDPLTGLVLDMRSNPGGVFMDSLEVASAFLPLGEPIVIERPHGKEKQRIYRSYGYDLFPDDIEMVVLVDRGSASAAEILAGAFQESGRATIVGEKTFGKGSVQELISLSDGSGLKVTVARWYTPNGNSISENGLAPDIEISYEEFTEDGPDLHMQKALEILGN